MFFILKIILNVLTDIRFIISFIAFFLVITVLFYSQNRLGFKRNIKKSKRKKQAPQIEPDTPKKDEPGKLYVPDSTYEILKKEGIMHNVDE